MSADILFGQSYFLRFDPKLMAAMQPYPPLGSLYAASYVRSLGYEVALFDAMLAESEIEWQHALMRHQPRFAVLFEDNFNYLSKMCLLRMRAAAFTMISMAKSAGCTVIVTGSDASDHPESYLSHGADFAIVGEGEITLGELLDRLTGRRDTPFGDILGLAWTKDIETQINPRRPEIRDLDGLPFPAWDLVDLERYRGIWKARHGYFSMNVASTRGCPYHCNWCAKPIWGQRYHVRSPENVIAEMQWLQNTCQPDHIWFVDDIFGLKPGWVSRFASLVEDHSLRLPFKSLNRVDLLLRDGEIEALRRAGSHTVWVGAESGSQKILDAMDKGTRVEQITQAVHRLHSAGIRVGFFLQFGYPGETRTDIEQTLQLVWSCMPDDIGMSVSYPLPGTEFFHSVKAQLGDRQNWIDSNDLAMLYQGTFRTDFYRQLHNVLHKEFRLRRAWQRVRQTPMDQPGRIPESLRINHDWTRDIAALLYHAFTLPLSKARLHLLARTSSQGLGISPQALSPSQAARPSPQVED